MTYDQVDAEDRGRPPGSAQGDAAGSGPASATRTDLPAATSTDPPKQTEFRLVSGTGAPESADDDDGPAPTVPQPIAGVPRQPGRPPADDDVPLLPGMQELRAGWQRVKASFVDNPHGAVAAAAGLTDEAAEALAAAIRERRHRIRASWDSEATARDTEALRIALLGYQALFDRITGER